MQRGLVSKGLPRASGAPEGQSWDLHMGLAGQSQSFSLTHLASVSSGDGQPSLAWKATVLRPSGLLWVSCALPTPVVPMLLVLVYLTSFLKRMNSNQDQRLKSCAVRENREDSSPACHAEGTEAWGSRAESADARTDRASGTCHHLPATWL